MQKYLLRFFIGLIGIFTIGGYLLSPDGTAYASRQIVECSQWQPLSSVYIAEKQYEQRSFGGKWLFGEPVHEVFAMQKDSPYVLLGDSIHLHLLKGGTVVLHKNALAREPYLFTFYLGTDPLGRDILSRLIIGTRYSVGVALLSMLLASIIGTFLGLLGGYVGGKIDAALMWLMSVFWSFPSTLLALALAFVMGKGFWTMTLALVWVLWVDIARFVRYETLRIKSLDYIKASEVLGTPTLSILWKHIFPNLWTGLRVICISTFTTSLILEGSLSFLGVGFQPPTPSWGSLLFDGFYYIVLSSGKWLLIAPASFLVLTVLAFQSLTQKQTFYSDARK